MIIVLDDLSVSEAEVLHVSVGVLGNFAGSSRPASLIRTESSAVRTVTVTLAWCLSSS